MKKKPALVLLALAVALSIPCVAADRSGLRGQRYGEILLGKGGLLIPSEFDVYNTIGLNDCPEDLWNKLDKEKIKKETGVKAVILNGPRYWVIDGLTASRLVSNVKRSFGGIEMRQAGTVELGLKDKLSLGKPYRVHKVARDTVWVFKSGKPVFQLLGPDGSVYFMQSFSVQKQKQSINELVKLASTLRPPDGWKFRTLTLSKDFLLKAENGVAFVVQDEFDNTYQKSSAKKNDRL